MGYSTTQTGHAVSDDQIMAWILAILEQENPWYGYRKVTAVLRQQYGLIINPKKVYRLMKAWHLLWPDRPPEIALSAQIGPELGHHATEPAVANGHHLRIYCGRRPFFLRPSDFRCL
ncbi:hypothetical protein TPY_2312 [Sulfobacillus acidophilus TPY]|nr:hypothetical protein TPY_2312 [Sulfobacillus acidophilus TPY]